MERFKSVLKILKNRYLIVGTAALIWMLFFDQYALVSRMKLQSQIAELKRDRDFYQKEIVRINEEKEALFTDRFALERFAREKYFMKKDNEDLFIVVK
ncbi:MAG: septum formation initiator family protein [Bacteroidia bacterium]|nr:septum formation initiator family protein [Bacteroidia bacterium]